MKKFYITTSIPYANAGPHIGHILDPLIADVIARYKREKGFKVRFLAGTDEHGLKIVRTARVRNKTPKQLVNENSAKFKALHKTLNLSWDDFIRTSDRKRHWPGAKKMWLSLVASKDIYRKKYKGFYCVGHEAFVTEKDLINGKCPDHQKEPELIEEENWFFRLSKYTKKIEEKIITGQLGVMPESRKNEILATIKEGLEDVSFSRPAKDLSWGVPVPNDPTQTMYVWCDALVNYISAIGYGRKDSKSKFLFKKWWPADVQIIGKDNLRFHTALWPGMLMSAKIELPKRIFIHGFVNVEDQKISKTVGNVIAPNEITDKYGIDAARYYFLREFSPYEDGNFSYKKFESRYNGDLANGLGNFSARVLTLASRFKKIPFPKTDKGIKEKISQTEKEIDKKMEEFKLHEALAAIWELIKFGDNYVNQTKPWEKTENKKEELANLVIILIAVANFLQPFLPQASKEILKSIKISKRAISAKKAKILFPRIN